MALAYFSGKRAQARRARDRAMLTRACVQALEPRTLLSASIQPAVPIVVNTTSDETNSGDGLTSLREAVTQANGAGGGAITFDPSVVGGTITLSLGNISIGNGVSITGPASRSLTVSGGGGGALEVATGATVSMSDFVVSGSGTALQIDSTGQASLQDVTLSAGALDNGSIAFSESITDTDTGSISGSGSVSKTGVGTLTLTGSNTYSAGTLVNGGVLAGTTNALSGNITTTSPGTLTFDQSTMAGTTGTFNGAITGTGAVHLLGPTSTVTMGPTATFANSGSTILDAGTTLVASATNDLSSTSTFADNGTLNLGGFAQTIGSLSGAATGLVYNISTQATLTATLTAGGDNTSTTFAGVLENVPTGSPNGGLLAVQKNGSGAWTLSGTNIFSAGLTLNAGQLNLNNASAIGTGAFTISGSTTFDNTSGGAITLSTNNAQNWNGDFTFIGSNGLNLGTGGVALASNRIVTVNANTLTVGGVISGAFSLTKAGPGTLTLSGANTYSGGTGLSAGQLNINNASAIGTGAFTISGSTTFDNTSGGAITLSTNNAQNWIGDFTFIGSNSLNLGTGAVTLASNRIVTVNANTLSIGGVISGAFSLTKAGAGTLTLGGANTYSAGTTLNVGQLNINNASGIGTGTFNISGGTTFDNTSGAAITLTTNNTQHWNGDFTYAGSSNLNLGTGAVTLASSRIVTVNANTLIVGGIISGAFSLTKAGSGALTLSGANTYSAGTSLNAGQLNINNASGIGSGALSIAASTKIDNTTAAAITLTTNNAQNWNGDFTFVGTSSLNLGTGTVPLAANRMVTVNANNLTVGGIVSGGFSLTKAGAGTLTLGGANTYSGGTNLNAGQLNINNATAIGTGALTISGSTTFDNTSGAAITLSNNNAENWNGDFTFGGSNNLNIGTANISLPASRVVTVNAAGSLIVGGIISGGFGLTKAGTGTLSLSGANTYSAGTLISGGVLVGNTTSLQGTFFDNSVLSFDQTINAVTTGTFTGTVSGSGAFNVLNGTVTLAASTQLRNFGDSTITGTLVASAANAFSNLCDYTVNGTMNLGNAAETIGSLQGSGTVYQTQAAGQTGAVTLTLGVDNSSTTFTGVLLDVAPASGNGGKLAINKSGTGTFTVNGANTFSGGLTVAGGVFGVGPTNTTNDPMGAGTVTLNGGNLALNGRLGTPVQQLVPTTGYNQDVIVEVGAANAQAATTVAYDGTYVWYEHGYTGSGATGLPANGTIFASAFNPSVNFQLQPYNGNNVAFINGGNGNVTLTLNTPTAFTTLNMLAAAASGAATMSAVLNFSDSSQAFTQLTVSDWFNGTQAAFTAGGRIARNTTAAVTLTTNNPRLYEYDYALPPLLQTKLLTSITFTETSGNQLGIWGLSGAASVVQPAQSYPNPVQLLSNAAIDVEGSMNATLGNLTMSASTLSLTGPSGANLGFAGTTLNVGSQFNTAAGTNLSPGAISGGSNTLTKLGPGTLTLSGPDTYGSTTVSAGKLVATGSTSLPNTALSIGPAGTAQLQQNPSAFTANISSINISAAGKLDLGNNKMFINYGSSADPIATIRSYLANGYNNGAWTGTSAGGNILSTRAAANAAQTTAIGYADSADGLISGQPVNTVELMYTLYGDTTLTGSTGFNDFTRMTQHWNQTSGASWDTGDFNYDGSVNYLDFTLMTRTYNTTLGSQAQPAAGAATPPATGSAGGTSSSGSTGPAPSSGAAHHHTSRHRGRRRR